MHYTTVSMSSLAKAKVNENMTQLFHSNLTKYFPSENTAVIRQGSLHKYLIMTILCYSQGNVCRSNTIEKPVTRLEKKLYLTMQLAQSKPNQVLLNSLHKV